MSPKNFYELNRQGYSAQEIISFCSQVISLAEAEQRDESIRLTEEANRLRKQRAESKPVEPWEDAPGVILEGIQPS